MLTVTAIVASCLGATSSVAAGGGTWWDLERAYAPGESVTEIEQLYFSDSGENSRGGYVQGPYFSYLLPSGGWSWELPGLPKNAIPVGRLALEKPSEPGVSKVTLDFEVPQVDPGRYHVVACNRPCTHEPGDLMRTPILIAASVPEARATRYAARQDTRLQNQIFRIKGNVNGRRALEEKFKELKATLKEHADRLDELEKQFEKKPEATTSSPILEPTLLTFSTMALILAAMVLLMRRRPSTSRPNVQG